MKRLAAAMLGCALLGFAGPAHAQSATPEFEALYAAGRNARAAGDYETAAEKLEAASRLRPADGDVLYLLGMTYGFQGHYDAAADALHRAQKLQPQNDEIALGLIRLSAWQGDFDRAAADADRFLQLHPDNLEVRNLRGRIAFYRGRHADAERDFAAVRRRAPDNLEALIGLGDVKAATGDAVGAERLYREAQAVDPSSPDARDRLARGLVPEKRWRFDGALSYSDFSRQPRSPWHESFNQLSYGLDAATRLHGRVEVSERFNEVDSYAQIGVDRVVTPYLSAYLYGGMTPDPDFRERWAALAGGSLRLSQGEGDFGATLLTLDSKWAAFDSGDVGTLSPGLQQYFAGDRVVISLRQINSFIDSGDRLSGWSARLDARLFDRWTVYAGLADAPETSEGVTVGTKSKFVGLIYDLTSDVAVRLDILREERENSYIREAAALGLSLRF